MLLMGVTMMVILLLIILYAFDVHNVIRAKMKVDIAQQSAALAGANWQKETLNLIGDINLLKASALLLEGSDNWKIPLPDREKEPELWRRNMQARVDLLTEMQTRVSFIGPLIGFAAAQQAAKANGLTRVKDALKHYIELLNYDKRYLEAYGGASTCINNYEWREPYINLVEQINKAGIAVFPNARVAGMPETTPRQLTNPRFYTEILRCAEAIAENDPPKRHYWYLLNSVLRSMDDSDFNGKWWVIDYKENRFPDESEIFTVGVEFGGTYNERTSLYMNELQPDLQIYSSESELPVSMKWCIYDQWWYPDYYRRNYSDYDVNHYDYWFGGSVLRREVKPQFVYEGPAAYTEGFADVDSVVKVRPSVRKEGFMKRTGAKNAIKSREHSILVKKSERTTRIGTRRVASDDSDVSTSYRPGSIAKVQGELRDAEPPIAVDIILPVFKRSSPMPTFMPIPYGFQVLKMGYSDLERFLNWLADQNDLNGTPPQGTERFLRALHYLVYGVNERSAGKGGRVPVEPGSSISGRGLRYYGYNHKFNKAAFETEFKEKLYEWYPLRDSRVFQQTVLDGPGWLQEPALFHNNPNLSAYKYTNVLGPDEEPKYKESRITTDKNGNRVEEYDGFAVRRSGKIYPADPVSHKVAMPDSINGGTAYRIYVTVAENSSAYYVIDSRNRIVLNGGNDPTILYNQHFGSSGGDHVIWNPGGYDNQKGPARL